MLPSVCAVGSVPTRCRRTLFVNTKRTHGDNPFNAPRGIYLASLRITRPSAVYAWWLHDVVSCSALTQVRQHQPRELIAIKALTDSVVEHAGGKRAGRHVTDGGERAQAEPRRRLDSNVYLPLFSHGSG